ncbi:thiol:disulfide interchange protein DsbA/DsbL [Janthinobacterium sp. LB3P118]|uniref:thiol:disulfide interchange protein DsbA/DsbL n=1 Tax=Janthinobacterium sp. LB3P118 TaxID=3424195 RepID=UPI003F238614
MKNIIIAVIFAIFNGALPIALAENISDGYTKGYIEVPKSSHIIESSKVEVIEFFSYGCPHCDVLDEKLNAWVAKNSKKIAFRRIHVFFGENTAQQQRLYFALDYMKKESSVRKQVFDEIHKKNVRLSRLEEITRLVKENGINEQEFLNAYNSSIVSSRVKEASLFQKSLGIRSIPAILVDQKFLTRPDFFQIPPSDKKSWISDFFSTAAKPAYKTDFEIEDAMFSLLDKLVLNRTKARNQ